MDNEIMTLYLKTFNMEEMYKKTKPKKFAFSVLMSVSTLQLSENVIFLT